jgi:hypothetical protein
MGVRGSQHGCAVELACFLDFQNFAAFVGAAFRASAMRLLALVAVRALGEADCGQAVMGAAFGGAGLGVTPLWICHYRFPFLHASRAASRAPAGRGTTEIHSFFQNSRLVSDPAAQALQGRPSWIGHRLAAIACFGVQMLSAMWAKPFAVFAAQGLRWQRQQHLLAQDVLQKNTVP